MTPRYLAIAFGPGKEYGLIIPYSDERSVYSVQDREITGEVNVLYDGDSFDEAVSKTSKLKDLDELMNELSQVDFIR
jgi:hypothetical protein